MEIAAACGFKWFAWWHTETHITIPLNRVAVESDYQRTTFPPTRFLVHADRMAGFGEYECADMSYAIDTECFRHVPDYLSDLNAMHEAEEVLLGQSVINRSSTPFHRYYLELHEMCTMPDNTFHLPMKAEHWAICATAAQRAEAFLRTIGKWDDSK